jgi:hypothetical protein
VATVARVLTIGFITGAGLAGTAVAQKLETGPAKFTLSPEYRAVQLSALRSQRKLLLSFADSMPESLYRDKVTPIQRSFSEQVSHVVVSAAFITNMFLAGAKPTEADTAKVLNTRAGLKQHINDQYDRSEKLLMDQTDADRDGQVKFFGNFIPRWQVWDELNQHAIWTAGQVVANFRKNGMTPPSFLFF